MSTQAADTGVVTLANLRKSLGEVIGRVAFGNERTTISKNGKTVAAIVPIEDLERLEQLELDEDSKALDAALAEDDGQRIDFDDYLASIA